MVHSAQNRSRLLRSLLLFLDIFLPDKSNALSLFEKFWNGAPTESDERWEPKDLLHAFGEVLLGVGV